MFLIRNKKQKDNHSQSINSFLLKLLFLCLIFSSYSDIFSLSSNPRYYTLSKKYHYVKKGEILKNISEKYSISVEKLKLFNNLNSDKVFIGQKIYLIPKPQKKSEFVTVRPIPKCKYHLVKPRESIYRISKMYDLGILDIVEFNDLNTLSLNAGQKIWLESGHLKVPIEEIKKEEPEEIQKESDLTEENKIPEKPASQKELFLPVNGKVTSEFGPRAGRQHKGIDISAPIGEPIYAAMDGKVAFAGTQKGYGNIVILEHDDYVMTIYAHNETNLVRLGEEVKKGQPIATLGDTGTTTCPHLHFEYRSKGKAINPREVLPDF